MLIFTCCNFFYKAACQIYSINHSNELAVVLHTMCEKH